MKQFFEVITPKGIQVKSFRADAELVHAVHGNPWITICEVDADGKKIGALLEYCVALQHQNKSVSVVFTDLQVKLFDERDTGSTVFKFGYEFLALPAWVKFFGSFQRKETPWWDFSVNGEVQFQLGFRDEFGDEATVRQGEILRTQHPDWWEVSPGSRVPLPADQWDVFAREMNNFLKPLRVSV